MYRENDNNNKNTEKKLPYTKENVILRNKNLFTSTVDNNEGFKRYFSSIDAEIYFGDIFIDDINRIEYSVLENTMPIFGYNSRSYDFLMYGTRMIQGEFVVNFTRSGWLISTIKDLKSVADSKGQGILRCTDREKSCGGDMSGLFKGVFDIVVSFGDHKSKIRSVGSSAHLIKGVSINGYSQMLDANGEPIAERYTFIAQDIWFNFDATGGIDNSFDTGINNPFRDKSKKFYNDDKKEKVEVADENDSEEVIKTEAAAEEENALALSVNTEHDKGNLKTKINILNKDIDINDIKIEKLSISPNDRRTELRTLPVLKSNEFRYVNNNIEVDIPLNEMPICDKKMIKAFNRSGPESSIDATMSIELKYKDTAFNLYNKSIKITPGETYVF